LRGYRHSLCLVADMASEKGIHALRAGPEPLMALDAELF